MLENDSPMWLSQDDVCELLNITVKTLKNKCSKGDFVYKIQRVQKKSEYFVLFSSLPTKFQNKYSKSVCEPDIRYSDAPTWAKTQADKYIEILKACEGLRGKHLKQFIQVWNASGADYRTSYSRVNDMRSKYREYGIHGLLANYGKTGGASVVPDKYMEYFKNLYLIESRPSIRSCWANTLGYAMRTDEVSKADFPSYAAFFRRLKQEVPEQAIFLARHGQAAWNRKYGNYIERDYSGITCGKVWVSDHAQIDVACFDNGKVIFPWVTAWRDFKSGKWLGWILQARHPNSDHIFQSFYYAVEDFGLPAEIIIDNGKDYRAKDFAGGRVKTVAGEAKTKAMLDELGVKVHFALPYNAQTKPIERDFLTIKHLLSKHSVGYRGGNVVERPEKLADEIKNGDIMEFEQFKKLFDDFVINVFNKKPSQGKNLKGLSPDELFIREYREKVIPSKDALKLFCMRTSKVYTIKRNGVTDNELGITYWADWMISHKSAKVYLRRDIKNFKEAWAFRAESDEFIGKIFAVQAVAALNADVVSKEEFKAAMGIKKRNAKITKSYIAQTQHISLEEKCENYKAAFMTRSEHNAELAPAFAASDESQGESLGQELSGVKILKIANTNMDKVIAKNKEFENRGKYDLAALSGGVNTSVDDEPIYLWETDKLLAEQHIASNKRCANGY